MGRPVQRSNDRARPTSAIAPRRARPILDGPTYRAPRYHTRLWGRLIFALFILALAAGLGICGALYWTLNHPQGSSAQRVTVHVGSGDSVKSLADRLESHGVIGSALLFRLDARLHNLGNTLKVGDYYVRRNMSIDQMVTALTVYHSQTIKIVIPEGRRMEQIAAILQQHGIDANAFLREARHPDFRLPILADKPAGAPLEGYLFPNTYEVPPHYSGRLFAEMMVRQLGLAFTPAMRRDAARRGWSVYQVLKLASIVEREARVPDERKLIASVYENRLHTPPYVLNADPTIQYAVGAPGRWWPVLTLDQLKIASPYNTYIHAGLPPTPIANPGLASILATIYPQPTNYFYFVAKGNGRHAFATTLAQQQANIAKYQHP